MTEHMSHPGGLWQPDGDGWRIDLDLDAVVAWHRWPGPVAVRWLDGDPAVLSYSENGHDAAACHLGPRANGAALTLPAGTWLTVETLGRGTTLGLAPVDGAALGALECAPAGWRPTPRGGGAGGGYWTT